MNESIAKLFDLSGKVAIVTGSSRGIGRAIATALAEAGCRVVISSRKQEACDTVAGAINAACGAERAIAIAASIASKEALRTLVEEARERLGPVGILVCNAASNPYYGPMEGIGDEAFRKILDNNILSSHWLAQMVAPDMKKNGGGSIVLVSSIGGFFGSATIGAYNLSKAADFQLVRNLAVELGEYGIRVNALAPGVTRTDFARALWDDPRAEAMLDRTIPLGRIGEPEDLAGAALFLASPAGRYVTGQAVVVDGGLSVRGVGL